MSDTNTVEREEVDIDEYMKQDRDELWTYITDLGEDNGIYDYFRDYLYDLFRGLLSVLEAVNDKEVVDSVTATIETVADYFSEPGHLPRYCLEKPEGPCDVDSMRAHLTRIANTAFYYRKNFHWFINNIRK